MQRTDISAVPPLLIIKSTHHENANTFSTVNAGLRPQILRIIFNAFPLALNGPFAHQRLHRFSAPPALCTVLMWTLSPSQKFDLILAYNFKMSTLFLINYHFKRINFCIKFESALQPHSPLSLRFSDDIAVSPHTDHRLSVSDSDNLRRSEKSSPFLRRAHGVFQARFADHLSVQNYRLWSYHCQTVWNLSRRCVRHFPPIRSA